MVHQILVCGKTRVEIKPAISNGNSFFLRYCMYRLISSHGSGVKVRAGGAGSLNPQFSDIYLWLALDDVVDAGV